MAASDHPFLAKMGGDLTPPFLIILSLSSTHIPLCPGITENCLIYEYARARGVPYDTVGQVFKRKKL